MLYIICNITLLILFVNVIVIPHFHSIVNDKTLFVLAFTAPDFGRCKRHISLQNPCASLRSFIVSEISNFAYYRRSARMRTDFVR